MHQLSRSKGFSLMEMAITMALAIGLVLLIATWTSTSALEKTRESVAEQTAREMVQISQAVRAYYMPLRGSLPAPGTRLEPTWNALINGTLLPAGFGQRDGLPTNEGALSPIGQRYRVIAIQRSDAKNIFEVVVWAEGAPRGRIAGRARIADDNTGLEAIALDVAGLLRSRYSGVVSGGMVSANTTDVQAGVNGFSIELSNWFGGTITRATPVAMNGLVQLAVDSELPPPGVADDPTIKSCQRVIGTTCPSGQRKLAEWPTCQGATGASADFVQIPTEAGALLLSKGTARLSEGRSECGGTCSAATAGNVGAAAGGCGVTPTAGTASSCNAYTDQSVKSLTLPSGVLPYTSEGGVLNWTQGGLVQLNESVLMETPVCVRMVTSYSGSRTSVLQTYPFGGAVEINSLCCQ